MEPQIASWTCSACSLDWVLRATALNPSSTRDQVVQQIGYPEQINENVGLTNINGPGQALIDVLATYNQPAVQAWLDFDAVYAAAQTTTGMMSGASWNHWVALRGVQGDAIWIANSAPGWGGVYELMTRDDFARLGSFSVVYLVVE